MPVKIKNYQNAQIYKISRKDGDTKHEYYGSTCNLRCRRNKHKSNCHNSNCKEYHFNVYKHIRSDGGWENYNLYWIEDFPCSSKKQLVLRERHWIETKKPTLNSNIPGRSIKEWRKDNPNKVKQYEMKRNVNIKCECGCIIQRQELARHKRSKKHIKLLLEKKHIQLMSELLNKTI